MCLRRRYLVRPIWRRLDLQSLWWPRNELRLFPKPLACRAYKGSHSTAEKSADVDGSSITRTDWSWLEGPTVRNLQLSISSIPISLPLIGLVQLILPCSRPCCHQKDYIHCYDCHMCDGRILNLHWCFAQDAIESGLHLCLPCLALRASPSIHISPSPTRIYQRI
jgi:hypothetical protein